MCRLTIVGETQENFSFDMWEGFIQKMGPELSLNSDEGDEDHSKCKSLSLERFLTNLIAVITLGEGEGKQHFLMPTITISRPTF